MKIFTHRCVSVQDVCNQYGFDYEQVRASLRHSELSFGCNCDTLVNAYLFFYIIEEDEPEDFDMDLMISLGE